MTFKGYIKGYININVKHRRSKNWDFFPPSKKFFITSQYYYLFNCTVQYGTVCAGVSLEDYCFVHNKRFFRFRP